MALISVIVPVYNTEQYLHRCIDSILAQTFSDFELLLVDDGSTDASSEICDDYAKKDRRVRVFHQSNQGQAAARNNALDWMFANSNSRWISFIDSDDWVHPRYLELLLAANEKFGTSISQCRYIETDSNLGDIPVGEEMIQISVEDQYTYWYNGVIWSKLYKIDCFARIRFPEGQIYEDVAIWYKLLFAEERIGFVKEILYYYYINQSSTVRKDWTPPRYARVIAWNNQVKFHAQNSRPIILECAIGKYLDILREQYYEISRSSLISQKEKKLYIFKTRVKGSWMILRYFRILIHSGKLVPTCKWVFPGLSRIIKKMISVGIKIKKLF